MSVLENLLNHLQKQLLTSPENKEPLKTSEDSNSCGKCNNGWISYKDQNGYNMAKECSCRKERIMRNRLRFANIPEAFKDMTLENFLTDVYRLPKSKQDINIVVGIVSAYLGELDTQKAQGMGLYVHSETKGSGKTRFIASLANEFVHKYDMQVKFATSTTIINEIKSTWDEKTRTHTETALLSALSTAEILIIDDFGTEKVRDWMDEKFYSIINERYNNKKITMYTSNYALANLEYGDRIKSRVTERVYQIPFPEESVREYIAEKNNADMIEKLRRDYGH